MEFAKKASLVLMVAAMVILAVPETSCKKKTKDPDYPQLVGAWKGLTSQSIPVEVDVANISGDLYVVLVNLRFSAGPGDTTTISRYNSDGLGMLNGTAFKVVLEGTSPNQTFIQGTFKTDTLKLSGNFTGYSASAPSTPVSGTYTALKVQ